MKRWRFPIPLSIVLFLKNNYTRGWLMEPEEDFAAACRANLARRVAGVEALLAAGADVNATTDDGETPLSIANDRLREAKDDETRDALRRLREALLKAGAKE